MQYYPVMIRPFFFFFLVKLMKCPSWHCAFISILLLPVFTPPVNIHAPVVIAALMRPFPKTCLSFGWSSKFWRPPCTEMRSLGSSSCHSLVIRCRRRSGFVSKDTRTYCRNSGNSKEKRIVYTQRCVMHITNAQQIKEKSQPS